MDCNQQAPLPVEFSRQEYQSGLPASAPGNLHDPGVEATSLASTALANGSFITSATWEAPNSNLGWDAGMDEAQAGIKSAGRNISNLRYAYLHTTLMAESEEELKSLVMKVKQESEKAGLNSRFKKLRSWHLVPSLHGK